MIRALIREDASREECTCSSFYRPQGEQFVRTQLSQSECASMEEEMDCNLLHSTGYRYSTWLLRGYRNRGIEHTTVIPVYHRTCAEPFGCSEEVVVWKNPRSHRSRSARAYKSILLPYTIRHYQTTVYPFTTIRLQYTSHYNLTTEYQSLTIIPPYTSVCRRRSALIASGMVKFCSSGPRVITACACACERSKINRTIWEVRIPAHSRRFLRSSLRRMCQWRSECSPEIKELMKESVELTREIYWR